jgi:hypothetical protein
METEATTTNPAIEKIAAALAKAQAMMTNPPKNRIADCGKRGRYMYADLADVLDHVRKPLTDNGLAIVQIIQPGVLLTRLVHESGQSLESSYPLPTGQIDQQAMGGAITYARRYSICPLLGIAGETDDDAQGAHDAAAAKAEVEAEEKRMAAQAALDAAKAKAQAAGEKAKTEGRMKSAYTGETVKPGETVTPAGNVPEKMMGTQAKPEATLAGIAPALAALMAKDGITPAQVKDFYVSKGHKPAAMEVKDLPTDYIGLLTRIDNWEKVKLHAKGMKQ